MHAVNVNRFDQGPWAVWLAQENDQLQMLEVVDFLHQKIASPEEDRPGARQIWEIHVGGRSTIYGVEVSGRSYCVKLFTDDRLLSRMRTFLGWSKARRAFRNGLLAMAHGVSVPQVYAYAERKPFGPALVIMELLKNANQMNLLIEERLANGITLTRDAYFLRLVEAFAKFTKDLHGKGICHNDFSPRNVLVGGDSDRLDIQLIDLEDIVFSRRSECFKNNISHFNEKMTRYVDAPTLELFLNKFQKYYGKG